MYFNFEKLLSHTLHKLRLLNEIFLEDLDVSILTLFFWWYHSFKNVKFLFFHKKNEDWRCSTQRTDEGPSRTGLAEEGQWRHRGEPTSTGDFYIPSSKCLTGSSRTEGVFNH